MAPTTAVQDITEVTVPTVVQGTAGVMVPMVAVAEAVVAAAGEQAVRKGGPRLLFSFSPSGL